MSDETNFRKERVEKLLYELQYEVTRGIMEGDLDEHMGFLFMIGVSKQISDGVVACEFRTRPVPRYHVSPDDLQPRLRVIK
ncbi:hypothetical protein [Rhizobium sp. BK456]|uniref:hypothetical protein n=1 Tax=Rhizobium sp. BK456 TaxID=2587007 RepID=UPI00160F155D|nr:hypothetical protein [Rhizobium sp. BK456]MBB3521029.1 hypothetical protein [Rhizobium sp. BK456]